MFSPRSYLTGRMDANAAALKLLEAHDAETVKRILRRVIDSQRQTWGTAPIGENLTQTEEPTP